MNELLEENDFQYDGEIDDGPAGHTDNNPIIDDEPTIVVGGIEDEHVVVHKSTETSIEEQSSLFAVKENSEKNSNPIEETETIAAVDLDEIQLGTRQSNEGQISFTANAAEISKYEYEVSVLKQKVHHCENCYSLSHSSADLAKLNSAKMELSNALSNLKNAKSK